MPRKSAALSARALKFVDCLLADPKMEQTKAAIDAGYAPRFAGNMASQLMKDPRIQDRIAMRANERLKRLELTQDDVLRDLYNVATADARELTEYRIGCCRYCHGANFEYQRTPAEHRRDLRVYLSEHKVDDPAGLLFDLQGGTGYDARKFPRTDCPECFGEGVGRTYIRDTRFLSEPARVLFAGVKEGRHGTEVMVRDKDRARELAARHTGVIKSAVEVTGPNGKPIQHAVAAVALVSIDPIEAAREYQKIMGG